MFDPLKPGLAYRNLKTNGYSFRQNGIVTVRDKFLALENCKFKVSEKGRLKVVEAKQKFVHAGVHGYITDQIPANFWKHAVQVTYNPYKYSTFVTSENLIPIKNAAFVLLTSEGVFAYKPEFI